MTWAPDGWTAGEKPPAARLDADVRDNLRDAGVWQSFDPALMASNGSAVDVGTDGVAIARYCRINDVVVAEYYIKFGTVSTAFGTSFYTWALPVDANWDFSQAGDCIGTAGAYHSSAYYTGVPRLTADNTPQTYNRFYVTHAGGPGAWSQLSPFTWVNDDAMMITITYEAKVTRPNLLSKQDSGLEASGIGGWVTGLLASPALTLSNSTARAILGTHSLLAVWPTASAFSCGTYVNATGLTIGETYTYSVDTYAPAGSPDVYADAWYQTQGAPPGWARHNTTKDAWARIATTFVATATTHYVGIGCGTAPTAGQTVYVDNARLEVGAVCTPPPFRTTATRVWRAGEKPTAAIMNAQVRDNIGSIGQFHEHAWVPTWTATGTAPALGNGTITGRYTQIGKTVFATLRLVMGSTTTYGTGTYIFSMPVARYDTGASTWPTLGAALCFNAGVADYAVVARHGTTTSNVVLDGPAGAANVNPTTPFTWGSGDTLSIDFCYEAA